MEKKNLSWIREKFISACSQGDMENIEKYSSIDVNFYQFYLLESITPLHAATKNNHPCVVRLLLSRGADINAKTSRGFNNTPLHCAVKSEYVGIVEILLHNDADLTLTDYKNQTPFFIAVSAQLPRLPEILLRYGEKSEILSEEYRSYYKLCGFLFKNDLVGAKNFLKTLKDVNFEDLNEESPIYFAVCKNWLEITKMLLEKGARADPHLKYLDSKPLLQIALKNGSREIVSLLLDHGARIYRNEQNWLKMGTRYMDTLLDKQVFSKFFQQHDFYLKAPDQNGNTILHWTCKNGKYESVKTFLDRFPELINSKNTARNSPLSYALRYDSSMKIANFLLKCDGIDPVDDLYHACEQETDDRLIKALTRLNDKLLTTKDKAGTLLHWASRNMNSSKPLQYLLSLDRLEVNERNNVGDTPLHENNNLIADNNRNEIALFAQCKKTELLLQYGANPWAENLSKQTPNQLLAHCQKFRNRVHNCPIPTILQKLYVMCRCCVNSTILGIFQDNFYENAIEDCIIGHFYNELENLKKYVINSNPKKTLFDVLFMNRRQMVQYSSNQILLAIYESCDDNFELKFFHYGFWLNLQMKRGLRRKPVIEAAKETLSALIGYRVPESCSENVLNYFDNNFLEKFNNEPYEF